LRNKFKALRSVRKPTGDPDCPPAVKRAKRIQREIEENLDVGNYDDGMEGELQNADGEEDYEEDEGGEDDI